MVFLKGFSNKVDFEKLADNKKIWKITQYRRKSQIYASDDYFIFGAFGLTVGVNF